jgi:hypothetical protein
LQQACNAQAYDAWLPALLEVEVSSISMK